jgi:sarcosine oxidase
MRYDVAVVGLGAMGSSTVNHLARRGQRVLGLERFSRAHGLGSSGGLSRIIRLAYFEHPDYVPLLRAAWDLWRDLERESGRQLLLQTGGVYVGREGTEVFDGAVRSAREHELPHEVLDAAAMAGRVPALRLDPDMLTLHEEMAGVLFPELAIETQLGLAEAAGADLRFDERVVRVAGIGGPGPLTIETDSGRSEAERLVLAAGAWLPELAPELSLPLTVERCPLFWFEPIGSPELLAPDRLPVWLVETDFGTYYGFPTLPGQGAKVARHHGGRPADPDELDREASPADEAVARRFVERHLPLAAGRRLDARVCMYTNTPDGDFILDLHPADPRIVVCSPCSGHGFKFSSVIGSIAADLAISGVTDHRIEFLSLARFARA